MSTTRARHARRAGPAPARRPRGPRPIDVELRFELEAIAAFMADRWRAGGFAYDGPHGFVLEHGTAWTGELRMPVGIMPGAPRMCFGNAITVGVLEDLAYVEGYAMHAKLPMPVHHAWNLDADGHVVDITWAPLAREFDLGPVAYLGVHFSIERADDATWNGDANVLDDDQRGWPLLRQRWQGEREDIEWPPSDRLAGLRLLRAGDLERGAALLRAGTQDAPGR